MMYNYNEAIKNDIRFYLDHDFDWTAARENEINADELKEQLGDELWINDSVTGNASGSYTFNSYKAMEYVLDNMELVNDMVHEFGIGAETVAEKFLNEDWEYFDVSIRCYLLNQCIDDVVGEYAGKIDALQREEAYTVELCRWEDGAGMIYSQCIDEINEPLTAAEYVRACDDNMDCTPWHDVGGPIDYRVSINDQCSELSIAWVKETECIK